MSRISAMDIWEKACVLIRKEITELSFDTWIAQLRAVDIDDKTLSLLAPSEFYIAMLARYKELITNATSRAMQRSMIVKFVLEEELIEEEAMFSGASSMFRPTYTFDNFVIGSSNRFAHAASLAVAETPAEAYNPLFIYGGVGLGKTHLMHAIGHHILVNNAKAKIVYITSESFTNELITAIKTNKNTEFRDRFRNVDVLLIDDIQFIAGRDSTQEEFFHTFNTLHQAGKQIIISSDKPPKEIPTLEERLRSRFEWGLIADIQRPDYETRIAILRKKAEMENLTVPPEVFELIADRIASNIRELEGSLTRVIAYSHLTGEEISLDTAKAALKDILALKDPKRITTEVIQQVVSDYFGVSTVDIRSKKRNREISDPRHIAMYLTRDMTELSLPAIGRAFGGRDHTTVLHACDKIGEELRNNDKLGVAFEDLKKKIQEH